MKKYQVICKYCKKDYTIEAKRSDMQRWYGGELIQNALPYLNADERELLVTRICGDCWDKLF